MKKFFISVFVGTCVEIKFYGAFAPPARWRGNAAPDALVDFHTGRHRPLGVGHEHLRAADDEEDGRVPGVVDVVPPRVAEGREVAREVRSHHEEAKQGAEAEDRIQVDLFLRGRGRGARDGHGQRIDRRVR